MVYAYLTTLSVPWSVYREW